MEFKLQAITTITVFNFECNSAIDPGHYKVVWQTNDHNKTTEASAWKKDPLQMALGWQIIYGSKRIYNFVNPSAFESINILKQYVK